MNKHIDVLDKEVNELITEAQQAVKDFGIGNENPLTEKNLQAVMLLLQAIKTLQKV